MVGPVLLNADLRDLPHVAPGGGVRRASADALSARNRAYRSATRITASLASRTSSSCSKICGVRRRTMPPPILTFEGGAAAQFCACAPPDTDGDVGPNHYVEAINICIRGL